MYAIIETGGKQYRVEEGNVLKVEKLAAAEGETVELDRVLALKKDDQLTVGAPWVAGVKVLAQVLEHGRGKKIIVFKYRVKHLYGKG